MDQEMRDAFAGINTRIDDLKEHLQGVCEAKHQEINSHLKDAPVFRDKVTYLDATVKLLWTLIVLVVSGCVGGFWWLLRIKG